MRKIGPGVLALVVAAGCSVPPTGLEREVDKLDNLRKKMEQSFAQEKFHDALAKSRKVAKQGSALAKRVLLGDPRRKTLDKALESARKIRRDIAEREERDASEGRVDFATFARRALEEAAESTEKVKPPPEGEKIDALLSGDDGGGGEDAFDEPLTGPSEGADDDERRLGIVRGDKAGDVDVPEERPEGEGPAEAARKPEEIDENTEPITIRDIKEQGNGVAVYFRFVNKGAFARIGPVNAEFIDKENRRIGYSRPPPYEAEGFKPNWDDIHSSTGKRVDPETMGLDLLAGVELVVLGEKPRQKITSVRVEVTMHDGKTYRARKSN